MKPSKSERISKVKDSNLLRDEYKEVFEKDANELIKDIEVHQIQVLKANKKNLIDLFKGLFCLFAYYG